MGLSYIGGNSWEQITRDERYFCAHLHFLIKQRGVQDFVCYLNREHGLTLDPSDHWEIGYEVCFYRDFQHFHRKELGKLPGKRTFDLCLLSDKVIVIIEAKAQQAFEPDQLENFRRDSGLINELIPSVKVLFLGLCSHRYLEEKSPEKLLRGYGFNGPILTWSALSTYYSNDVLLERADGIYESQFRAYRKYNEQLITGEELATIACEECDGFFWVGRSGGLNGKKFLEDVHSGNWRSQKYETNRSCTHQPSSNWFSLQEFIMRIKQR